MANEDTYLKLLFGNVAHLLSVDLNSYQLHPVEQKYFDEVIEFFRQTTDNVKSFNESNDIRPSNLLSFYAIPTLFDAIESNPVEQNENNNAKEFFEFIFDALDHYKKEKNLEPSLKVSLKNLFEFLSDQFSEKNPFEKIEVLSRNRQSLMYA